MRNYKISAQFGAVEKRGSSTEGSALVLVLLVTALLTTIAVSFLSTSRVEQIAAKNFTRQNAASGLAEMATQQAMAKIQQGFTVNGSATTVITTQPGAIRQFEFSGGNCTPGPVVELFSGTGNTSTSGTANLNNLQAPSSSANATSGQWTITGIAGENIQVPLEEVRDSDGNLVGKIAYYVDDEGTKINLNAATGDRPTLNIGSSRSLSLSAVASANQAENFTKIINGNVTSGGNAPSDIKNWSHFFRPEQVAGAVSGFDANAIPNLSAAPTVGNDYHIKKTPWGTDRLFINDLPIDSTGVDAIYDALSSDELRDIYGTTFADKYTPQGLKQIAANLLQARDPNVLNDWNNSFTYDGPLLGYDTLEAITDCCSDVKAVIPADYLGHAPYPFISEVGVTVCFACISTGGNDYWQLVPSIRPFIAIQNPWRNSITKAVVDEWWIEMQIDSLTYDISFRTKKGTDAWVYHPTHSHGPEGFDNPVSTSWGHSFDEASTNAAARKSASTDPLAWEVYFMTGGPNPPGNSPLSYKLGGGSSVVGREAYTNPTNAPAYSEEISPAEELQFPCPPFANDPNGNGQYGHCFQLRVHKKITTGPEEDRYDQIEIVDISNIRIKFEYIRLLAREGDDTTVRDWVLGEDAEIEATLYHPDYPDGFPKEVPMSVVKPPSREQTRPPTNTVKRIDGRLKTPINVVDSMLETMRPWSESGNESWPDSDAPESASKTNNNDNVSFPIETEGNNIPGDPAFTITGYKNLYFAYDVRGNHLQANNWPAFEFGDSNGKGIYASPADLGKIQTNVRHRKLRMATQHPKEVNGFGGTGNATHIPDWAMLDVISFGSNETTVPPPAPINLNTKFHVPAGPSVPSSRTVGIEAVTKAFDTASIIGNPFTPSNNRTVVVNDYLGATGNASSAVAANVGNMTWTTGNFSGSNATIWNNRRLAARFPLDQFVLPAEVTEVKSLSDIFSFDNYQSLGNAAARRNIKKNEGRLSAFFPGATTQSRHFTIYAYAQALDIVGNIDSESVTKTLVEVEEIESTPTTIPPTYTFKVKKIYTQPIRPEE